MQYEMAEYTAKKIKKLTFDSIVSETENSKKKSEYIGDHPNQTMKTTGQSTIKKPTTETQENNY